MEEPKMHNTTKILIWKGYALYDSNIQYLVKDKTIGSRKYSVAGGDQGARDE